MSLACMHVARARPFFRLVSLSSSFVVIATRAIILAESFSHCNVTCHVPPLSAVASLPKCCPILLLLLLFLLFCPFSSFCSGIARVVLVTSSYRVSPLLCLPLSPLSLFDLHVYLLNSLESTECPWLSQLFDDDCHVFPAYYLTSKDSDI